MQAALFEKESILEKVPLPTGQQSRIRHLGGVPTPKKDTQKFQGQSFNQPIITFSQSNPFYYVHQALQVQSKPQPQEPEKNITEVIQQIQDMKQICDKLLSLPEQQQTHQQQTQYPKTLIMDLQDLQTRRTNIDLSPEVEVLKSSISIKENLQTSFVPCQHEKCDQINQILEKALGKIQQLTEASQILTNQLENETKLKIDAEHENKMLREKIAKLDDVKCSQIESLKKKIERLQKKEPQHPSLFEIGRVPIQNIYDSPIKQKQILKPVEKRQEQSKIKPEIMKVKHVERQPLQMIKPQVTQNILSKHSQSETQWGRKLNNIMYL